MSVVDAALNPRQTLSKRQAATVERLLEAGLAQLRENGYQELSLRAVAARAGVTHTTAYSYFGSKAHLIAAIFWHRVRELPEPSLDPEAPLSERLTAALHDPGLLFAGEPELTDAATAAVLLHEPDIRRLRDAVGAELARRISTALGPDADPEIVDIVLMAFSGAMLQAGMGYMDFPTVVRRITRLGSILDP